MHDPRRRSPKQDDDLLLKSMLCFRFAEIRFLISNRSGPGGVITWDDFIRDPLVKKKALQGEYTLVLKILTVATSACSDYFSYYF